MCNALGKPEWIDDPRFSTTAARFRNVEERKRLTSGELVRWNREEILARLNAEDVPSAPLLTRLELLDHEQIVANDIVGIYEFEDHGRIRLARPAARFEETPAAIRAPAPRLGEHSEAILADLGYSAGEIGKIGGPGRCSGLAGGRRGTVSRTCRGRQGPWRPTMRLAEGAAV